MLHRHTLLIFSLLTLSLSLSLCSHVPSMQYSLMQAGQITAQTMNIRFSGGRLGMQCTTLRGLEGQFQPLLNFKILQGTVRIIVQVILQLSAPSCALGMPGTRDNRTTSLSDVCMPFHQGSTFMHITSCQSLHAHLLHTHM